MDQLIALTNILEYNNRFKDFIIFNCPCYKTEYEDFNRICIENKSYVACIVVIKESTSKIIHLKLPIVFGSLIDYKIRGPNISNYNQFGCLYLDGCVKVIYNFISNNLTPGHIYSNKKSGEEYFIVNIDDHDYNLHMKYDPSKEETLTVSINDVKFEKCKRIEKNMKDVKKIIDKDKQYDQPSKKKKQKTKIQKTYDLLVNEYETLSKVNDTSSNITWEKLINRKGEEIIGRKDVKIDFDKEDYIDLFNAYLQYAPKLDDISNKVNRTLSYIIHRALIHTIDSCYIVDKELKNINQKLTNLFKNGNMYFTLAQYLNSENKLVKGFKSIYQNIEAQKINLSSLLTSTIKRSMNDKIKNSKALLYPVDGHQYTCTIDSREMKGAGENVMLSQLVIIPIGIETSKVVNFIINNKEILENGEGPILQCVINSFLQPFKVNKSNLLKLKEQFPTLSLMLFGKYLIINTNGYNQMKYSVKYKCFMNTREYLDIWNDAFDDYHPHLVYNSCAMFLPETIELGRPAKLTVANANVRGRCLDINNILELVLFLHTNGANNAAIIHTLETGDKKALVTFDGMQHKEDYHIIIPIQLKNPQMRYLKLGECGIEAIPDNVKVYHDNFDPNEDETEAYGMSMKDILINGKDTIENIFKILNDLYENDTRLEFINVNTTNLLESDEPLLINNNKVQEQIIYDNKMHHLKCYVRKNNNEAYNECIKFDVDKKHPPHMYVYTAFGDILGGTNEDGIIIDKKLVEYGPKKLISQTLNITYRDDTKKDVNTKITYTKIGNIIDNEIIFGCLNSNVKLTFSKTKNTFIKETYVPPYSYYYMISVNNVSNYKKYISSTFLPKSNNINIHFSYLVPMGIGTKLSTGHGQKGVICKVVDLSFIKGYTKTGKVVHPLVLFSPTSVLGRTMSSQVMSMFIQPDRAFTKDGVLISPHGINIHNIDPSIKTRISEVKNDLMTTENGFLTNNLSYMMKILSDQKASYRKDKHKMHFIKQLCALQGIYINLLSFNPAIQIQSI